MTEPRVDQARSSPGVVVLAACVVVAASLLTSGHPFGASPYHPGGWIELFGLAVAGCTLITVRSDARSRGIAAAAGGVFAAQLAGGGIYAFRRWVPLSGMVGPFGNLTILRGLALTMAAAMVVAALACLGALIREGCSRHPMSHLSRIITVGVGVTTIICVPAALAVGGTSTRDLSSLAAYSILYSIPYGCALVATAWLTRAPALAALGTVAVSAALVIPWQPTMTVVEIHNAMAGFIVALIAVGVAGTVRMLDGRGRDSSLLDSPGPKAPP